ncbi:MAG: UDP-glucose 4-epimerase GalE [Chlamydiia bacterium]|nr:UDP-glucose 4-epimerase GalE [Chlamydiia bacterium]
MSCILVTGGAGYIGSHICKALSQKGYLPITIDNLSLGHEWAVKWGPLFKGDCGNPILLEEILNQYPILGVIHLAAFSNVRESQHLPLNYYQNNVQTTLNLLEVLKKHHISHFVFSSTCAVYGIPKKIPIDESHPKCPINPYGESKWMVEKILESMSSAYGMNVAILRYFNAAGADPDGEIGEAHHPETHLIPLLIQTATRERPSFTLYGEDHPTEDGTAVRDFIHVTDLAEAHVRALEFLIEKKESLTLNLGTGIGYSVREMIEAIEKRWECNIPVIKGERFSGDPPTLVANGEKGRKSLNWTPQYSDLETIIDTAWNWHTAKVPLYK